MERAARELKYKGKQKPSVIGGLLKDAKREGLYQSNKDLYLKFAKASKDSAKYKRLRTLTNILKRRRKEADFIRKTRVKNTVKQQLDQKASGS